MRIFNKEPNEALWEIVSPLSAEIPIYKEAFADDKNSEPDSYLIIRADVANSGWAYGDGECELRKSDCDIILVSKGLADGDCLHNRNKAKVEKLLKTAGVAFYGNNLGYNTAIKSTEYTWSVKIIYGEGNERGQ